jgi:hypothetical protein
MAMNPNQKDFSKLGRLQNKNRKKLFTMLNKDQDEISSNFIIKEEEVEDDLPPSRQKQNAMN